MATDFVIDTNDQFMGGDVAGNGEAMLVTSSCLLTRPSKNTLVDWSTSAGLCTSFRRECLEQKK
jgi:hypothetical protein